MLAQLNIKNFALIQDLEVSFDKGLTTITGETGAGKSIILTAVSLLTGNRADRSMVRNQDKKCVIEAEFKLTGLNLQSLFEKYDFDYSDSTIIRREFNKDGKSRVFVNDSPAVLLHLKDIVNGLLDVHSQHENLELNKRTYQLDAIDLYAGLNPMLKTYFDEYEKYRGAEKKLAELEEKSVQMRENAEFISFQMNELNDADLKEDEQEILEAELDTLNHAEEIKLNLHQVDKILNKHDGNLIDDLNEVSSIVRKTRSHIEELKEADERLESLIIELDDVRKDLERITENTSYDPDRFSFVQDRLSLIYQLQHKHRLTTVKELIEKRDSLGHDFEEISNIDDLIAEYRIERDDLKKSIWIKADDLSLARKEASIELCERVLISMKRLGMPRISFEVKLEKLDDVGPNGKDSIEFLFSANEGVGVKPISKVASGGELSRLMLSIKATLAEKSELASIIFDEIDTGISGDIADKMGNIILEMGSNTQVIAITHLPQIAAKGARQLKVYKEEVNGSTITRIKELGKEERVQEIARLLSGEDVSQQAIENARVLLSTT